jgi:pimeloyl-ACP methyl ester carboxylesterase
MARTAINHRLRQAGILAAFAATGGGALVATAGTSTAASIDWTTTPAIFNTIAPRPVRHMVLADGHKLAFYVTPGHLPAIVLDAGGGLDHTEWTKVTPTVARDTGSEIITYDRPGFGASPEVRGPWLAQPAAVELHDGLEKLGVNKDVVLVPHSLAGEIAFHFVRSFPGEVVGAVLVDPSLPAFYTRRETARIVAANTPLIAQLQKGPSTESSRQLIAVAANYGPIHLAYHKMTWPKSLPTVLVGSSQTPYTTTVDSQAWRTAQKTFVAASPNRRLVIAPDSTHTIPDSRPSTVIAEIENMIHQLNVTTVTPPS